MKVSTKLKRAITSGSNVLIVTHMLPDHDAICSVLLLSSLLKKVNERISTKIKVRENVGKIADSLGGAKAFYVILLGSKKTCWERM